MIDDKSILSTLIKYNFWSQAPDNLGQIRSRYLQTIEDYLGANLIKVLVGQRRVGKSYVLKQIIHHLITTKQINKQNILYINFENEKFSFIKNKDDLTRVIDLYLREIKSSNDKAYIFLDEIQEIQAWEKLVNSYLADHTQNLEIFITGSNSKLLSSEFSTYITGRFVEIHIHPFGYKEFLELKNLESNKTNLISFITGSALPESFNLTDKEEVMINFLRSIKNSILLNDIVKRYQIQNVDLLEKLFSFLVDNIANLFSLNGISRSLDSMGIKTNPMTVANYIKHMEDTFLFYGISRYDLKGKRILEGEKKYYLNDIGFRNFLSSSYDAALSKKLENFVFMELKNHGYEIYVANINGKEVDFMAEKHKHKIYLQVTVSLNDTEVQKREYTSIESIQDHWEKYIISLDDLTLNPKEGIRHIQAWNLGDIII